jgi:hypothetical protein
VSNRLAIFVVSYFRHGSTSVVPSPRVWRIYPPDAGYVYCETSLSAILGNTFLSIAMFQRDKHCDRYGKPRHVHVILFFS